MGTLHSVLLASVSVFMILAVTINVASGDGASGSGKVNADLTEYVADCAREEEAAENGIPLEEPCQQEDYEVA